MFCKEFLALNSRKCLAKAKQDTHKKYKKLFEPIVLGEERLFSSTFSHYIHSTQQYIGKKEVGRRAVLVIQLLPLLSQNILLPLFLNIVQNSHIFFKIENTQRLNSKLENKKVGWRAVCWSSSCYHFCHKTHISTNFVKSCP